MEKEEIRIEAPVAVSGVILVTVVKASLNHWEHKGRLSFFSIKQPVSVVVVFPQAKRAFRISGEEISLDELAKEVPGLEEVLEGV